MPLHSPQHFTHHGVLVLEGRQGADHHPHDRHRHEGCRDHGDDLEINRHRPRHNAPGLRLRRQHHHLLKVITEFAPSCIT